MIWDILSTILGFQFGSILTKPSIFYIINGIVWIFCLLFNIIKKVLYGMIGFLRVIRFTLNVKQPQIISDTLKGF